MTNPHDNPMLHCEPKRGRASFDSHIPGMDEREGACRVTYSYEASEDGLWLYVEAIGFDGAPIPADRWADDVIERMKELAGADFAARERGE